MSDKKYTVEEIANKNQEAGGHYFDKGTMKVWGQRLSDFEVYQTCGRVFVFGKGVDPFWSVAEFNPETGRVTGVRGIPDSMKWDEKTTGPDIKFELGKLAAKEVA